MDFGYLMLVFIAMAAVTFAERALPFAASKWLQNAAVARDAAPTPEVVSIAFAFVLQWFLKNPLVSIFAGTALYVAWVNGYLPF